MRVLISVRSAAEALDAFKAGADIIDAKEPDRGPLGMVSPETLATILKIIPPERDVSIALGDFVAPESMAETVSSLMPRPTGITYLKVGLAGAASSEMAQLVLEAAVAGGSIQGTSVRTIAVGYADWRSGDSVPPEVLCRVAADAGCHGILLDTYHKTGKNLLDLLNPTTLAGWVSRAHRLGLLAGLAGSLGPGELEAIASTGTDVIGFRGAACDGGRGGRVSRARVRRLMDSVKSLSDTVQGIGI
jgi:uncharacterized protein (UPF0264 family)